MSVLPIRRFPLTRGELSKFLPSQRSIRVFENLFQTTDALERKVDGPADRTEISPFRTVYVDVNGDDSNDGSILNPLLTIEAAVTLANDISTANVFVAIGAGRYSIDNPLPLPNNTFLVGWDRANWVVDPVNLTEDIFQISEANAEVVFIDGAIIGLGTTGHCINQTGSGSTVLCFNMTIRDFAGVGYRSEAGSFFCEDTELSELDTGNIGYQVSNGATMTVVANRILDDATLTTAFEADGAGTKLNVIGPTFVQSTNITTFLNIDNGADVELLQGVIDGPTTGITIDNASSINSVGTIFKNTTTDINIVDTASAINFVGASLDKNKITFPDGFVGENMLFQDNTEGEGASKIYGDLFIGRPERGSALVSGKGENYTRGMVVLTTDDTATSTTDGGSFVDVSTEATSPSGSTFSFQDVDVNHTILFGSSLSDGSDKLIFWGVEMAITTAAVEVSAKSFTWEYWDGAAWSEITVFSHEETQAYRYGNVLFIRANNTEDIHFNSEISSGWTKKTINGSELYWVRVRINTTVTTAPVFEQAKLITDQVEVTAEGATNFHGMARFKQTIVATGNVFSDTGGIASANVTIGSGGDAWLHRINNAQINGADDAHYIQFIFPKGLDTSCPININIFYQPVDSGASTDATIDVSVLPIEIQGVLVADPAGGSTPTARTLANTKAVTADAPQVTTISAPCATETKIQQVASDPVNISDFYEGDMCAVQIQFTGTGSADKDFIIWGIEIDGTFWTLGERGQV